MQKTPGLITLLALLVVATVATAAPPTTEELSTTVKALKKKLQDQQLRLVELERLVADRNSRAITREETLKLIKEMNADAAGREALPKWMENLKFYGDLRLRYQGECSDNDDDIDRKTRHRARFRLRFGIKKTWLDRQIEVGFRLATGSADADDWNSLGGSDPTSTNQSFDGLFSEKPIWVDRAWATYRPIWLKGLFITGGKIANPFRTSYLFIDSDVNPEGAFAQYSVPGLDGFEPFVGMGWFILEETASGTDTQMHGYTAGFDWKIAKGVKWAFAANLWDYDHYDDAGAPSRGNTTGWSLDFLVLNLHNKVGFEVMGLPISVFFDYAQNLRESERAYALRGRDKAFHAGVKFGTNKKAGDWSAGYEYAYIEHNSLPGFFADGDFARTNRRGHVLKGKYNITDFLAAGLTVFLTEPIRSTDGEDELFLVQADLLWKF